MPIHYIYITTNELNGKKYIGQRKLTKNIIPENDSYLGSGTRLLNSINKHGKDFFTKEILCVCNNQKDVDRIEIELIKRLGVLGNKNKWYNIDCGGQYGRSEEHSKLTSEAMKRLYSTSEALDKVIRGKNKSLIHRGLKPLPYNNQEEYIIYHETKKENNILTKIVKCNKKKVNKIKRLKLKSKLRVKKLTPEYANIRINAAIKAQQESMNPLSLEKRKQSQCEAWDKRKQSTDDNWTYEAKKAFSLGKCKQYNNPIGMYLIDCNVPIWDVSLKNQLRVFNMRKKKGYKSESNKILQANKIVNTIKDKFNIDVDICTLLTT